MNILSSLPTEEYDTLKIPLCTRVDPINLEELYSLLLNESEISKLKSMHQLRKFEAPFNPSEAQDYEQDS
ncbi:hypothetical protein EJ110_NYTH26512 [Nymphaea thermarum]|nr:hypothetical protein EJ110_NYTH26512 [Nymphaea thermarum]